MRRDSAERRLAGDLLVTAEDGGLLLMTADGVLWPVQPDEIVSHTHDDDPFVPLAGEQLSKQLLGELPPGFDTHATAHYLICFNTSREYANWCGALFERLHRAFTNFWQRKGFDLHESKLPLVAIVFGDRESYLKYARQELGDAAESIIGYYSLRTNRVVMYDLTGIEALRRPGDKRSNSAQINQMLSRPEAENAVATVIHEATHQIAFNCGLQTRFADIPLWVSEGIAVYFETPDLQNSKGWRTIGGVNQNRLARFRDYLSRRPARSLKSLIVDDKRTRDPETALDAYAEAWALNYYLIRNKPKQFVEYLQALAKKQQLVWDTPDERLKLFQDAFGADLERLDADFVRQMQKVR